VEKDLNVNATTVAQQLGYSVRGQNPDGTLHATDEKGNSYDIHPEQVVHGYLLKNGIDPARANISINDPATALPDSPEDFVGRYKLSSGNQAGNVEYLAKKYQDVKIDKEKGMVVNDKGTWKQIDPDMLKGDPWTISEGIKDLADIAGGNAPQIVGQVVGGLIGRGVGTVVGAVAGAAAAAAGGPTALAGMATGAAVGGQAGTIIGAGAGAAGGNELRIRLGKAFGTYKDTDQGHLDENALEALAAMTSETLPLATKPTWGWFKGVMGKISKGAGETAKDAIATGLGATTSAGPEATRVMLDQTPQVEKVLTQLKAAGARTPSQIAGAAAERQVAAGKSLLNQAVDALPEKYGNFLDGMFSQAEAKGIKVSPGEVAKTAQDELGSAGYGKVISTPGGGRRLVQYSVQELADRRAAGLEVPTFASDKEIFSKFSSLFNELETFSKIPEIKGAAAAKQLTEMNKALNGVSKGFYNAGVDPSVMRATAQAQASIRNQIGQVFEKAGMGEQFSQGSQLYAKYGDAVENAKNLLDKGKGIQNFVNKYVKSATVAGKNLELNGEVKLLAELAGPQGRALTDDIIHSEVASRFAPMAVKLTGGAGALGGVAYATGHHALGVALTAATVPATSPRMVMATAPRAIGFTSRAAQMVGQYGDMFINSLIGIRPEIMSQILKDPRALPAAMQTLSQAMQGEQKIQSQLLQQAGAQNGR
jgi:hypothetical protein